MSKEIVKAVPGGTKDLMVQSTDLVMSAFKNVAMLLEKEKLKPAALAMVYRYVDKDWPGVMKDIRDAVRLRLMEKVEQAEDAEVAKEGQERSLRTSYSGKDYKIQRSQYKTKQPTDEAFEQLLRDKEVPLKKYMTQTISYSFSVELGKQAIADGVITAEEYESCRRLLPASLKVEPL